MAKGKTQSKSDAIREEFKNGVTAPKDVVANLAKKGLKVSAALVSQIKARELTKVKGTNVANGKSVGPKVSGLTPEDIQAVLNLRRLVTAYGVAHVKRIVDEVATHAS